MDIYDQTLDMAQEHANKHKELDAFSSPYMARLGGWVSGFCSASEEHNNLIRLIELAFYAGAGMVDTSRPGDHIIRAKNLKKIKSRLEIFKTSHSVPELKEVPKALSDYKRRRTKY